jgi:CheY-like chemotaxis protein
MTILLVDDDQDDIDFFIEAIKLINKDYKVVTCGNGIQCLQLLDLTLPDVIFLDINMPLMDGKECLSEIRKRNHIKHVPVVMCSTSINSMDAELFKKLNARYLKKSSGYNDFVDTLKAHLMNS